MALGKKDFRSFHKHLYAGLDVLETVTLLRREDNQQAGTVTKFLLFNCRFSRIFRAGQEIDGSMSSENRRTLHLPKSEMDRQGVGPIRNLDRFVDKSGRTWEPESPVTITEKLAEQHIDVPCLRID